MSASLRCSMSGACSSAARPANTPQSPIHNTELRIQSRPKPVRPSILKVVATSAPAPNVADGRSRRKRAGVRRRPETRRPPLQGLAEDESAEGADNRRHGLLYAITPLGQPGPSMGLVGPG